jgi:predicted chitinase
MLDNFLIHYPFGKLSELQKSGISFLIDKLKGSQIQSQKQQAYVLATVKHECADRWQPITELGSQKYLMSKPYYPFIGRGFVQITWKDNYERFGKILGIKLVDDPMLALRPEISWHITEIGMVRGLFTGKKLSDYFEGKVDWINARKIINRLDKAELIADYAQKIYKIIEV